MRGYSAYERFWMVLILLMAAVPLFLALQAFYWPEKSFEAAIIIDRSREKIWPYLVEPTFRTRWETGLTDILPSLGEPGESGSRAFAIFYLDGARLEAEEEVIAIVLPERLEKITHFGPYTKWSQFGMTEDGGRKITYRERIRYHSFADRFWAPFKLWGHKREIENMLGRLQRLIESSPRGPQ